MDMPVEERHVDLVDVMPFIKFWAVEKLDEVEKELAGCRDW
jgi:hypothetical protein